MTSHNKKTPIREEELIEIDATPDLSKQKPIVILERREFVKLIANLKGQKEHWIAMRFNDSIFVMWRELVFLHLVSGSTVRGSPQ